MNQNRALAGDGDVSRAHFNVIISKLFADRPLVPTNRITLVLDFALFYLFAQCPEYIRACYCTT